MFPSLSFHVFIFIAHLKHKSFDHIKKKKKKSKPTQPLRKGKHEAGVRSKSSLFKQGTGRGLIPAYTATEILSGKKVKTGSEELQENKTVQKQGKMTATLIKTR